MKFFGLFVLFCILNVSLGVIASGFQSELDYSYESPDLTIGIPSAIIVSEDGIWTGGENGLMDIRAGELLKFSKAKNSAGISTWVTDIDRLNNRYLLISVYGNGLYLMDTSSNEVRPVNTSGIKNRGFWKTDIGRDKIIVSTLSNIHIYNIATMQESSNLRGKGIVIGDQVVDLAVDDSSDGIWWIDRDEGLFFYSFASESWAQFNLSIEPSQKLHTLTIDEEHLYIGADSGVLIFNKMTKGVRLVSSKNISDEDSQPVRSIFIDKNEKVWVAAENLYYLDSKQEQLIAHEFLQAENELLIVTDMAEDRYRNLFAVDTTHGLVVLSDLIKSISATNLPFTGQEVMSVESMANSDTLLSRNNSQVAVTNISEDSEMENTIFQVEGRRVLYGHEAVNLFDEEFNLYPLDVKVNENYSPSGISGKIDEVVFKSVLEAFEVGGIIYALVQDSEGNKLLNLSHGYKEVLPYFISNIRRTTNDSLILTVDGVGIFEIAGNSGIKQIDFGISHQYQVYTSIYSDNESLLIGTSGNGFLFKDLMSGDAGMKNSGPGFIRDVVSLDKYWLVAANNGLFAIGKEHGENIFVGKSFGITDSDFQFDGIEVTKNFILVRGDKQSNLLEKNSFLENLKQLSQKKHNIDTSKIKIEIADSSVETPGSEKGISTVEDSFTIGLPATNYVARGLLSYEYKLTGRDSDWIKLAPEERIITLSELPVDSYSLKIRIHDPRSHVEQPVTTIPLNVLPPWWRTWQAMMVYLVIVIIGIYLAYRSYLKRVDEQGAMLTTLVEEKNSVIQDTNQFMQRMLRNKQRAMANLSHEIRTPLTLILGPLKEVLEAPDSDKTVERIELATRNADRISVLVDQMLELEKLEYIKTLPPQHYELDHDMPRIMFDLKAYAALKKHQLTWQCSGQKRITLFTDSLEKILSNLVSNAVKYTPEGGKIGVSVKQRQLQLVIEVSDNGAGMTEEQVDKIFERYTRLENEAEGTGVGLALVKELVIANGGHIKVESEPGAGSCFTVFLPMTGSTTKSQAMAKEVKENPARHYNIDRELAGEGKVILVVDDNEELRTYIRDLLGGVYRCLMASNGKEALDIVARAKPDLVLTDYKMPDMDGLAFAKALRRDDSLAKVPLIFMSAFGDPKSIRLALEAGADSYMTKPVEKPLLLSRISNLFERYQPVEPEVTEHVTEEPEDELPEFENEQGQRFYFKALELMEKHYGDEDFTKPVFAEMMAVSDRHLQRLFQSSFDKPFNAVIREFRLEKARGMLEEGMQITQISYDTGFASPSHFSRAFKDVYHTTPSKYQKEHYHFKRKA